MKSLDFLEGITFDSLHLIFADTKRYLLSVKRGHTVKHDPWNLEAICTVGTRVAVEWRKDNFLLDWKPSLYLATVRMYDDQPDMATLEYVSEAGKEYTMPAERSVKEGRLKVARTDVAVSTTTTKPLFRHDVVKKLHSLWGRV